MAALSCTIVELRRHGQLPSFFLLALLVVGKISFSFVYNHRTIQGCHAFSSIPPESLTQQQTVSSLFWITSAAPSSRNYQPFRGWRARGGERNQVFVPSKGFSATIPSSSDLTKSQDAENSNNSASSLNEEWMNINAEASSIAAFEPLLTSNEFCLQDEILPTKRQETTARDIGVQQNLLDQATQIVKQPKKQKIAMIFNLNARSVRQEMIEVTQSVFANVNETQLVEGTVFVTATAEDAASVVDEIVENLDDYALIVPVGGDGTLSTVIQLLCERIQAKFGISIEDAIQRLCDFAYVPMGTGNGLGSVVGCQLPSTILQFIRRKFLSTRKQKISRMKRLVTRLMHAVEERIQHNNKGDGYHVCISSSNLITTDTSLSNDRSYETLEMPMIHVTARSCNLHQHGQHDNANQSSSYLCFFAGVGFDSLMLNDYKCIKAWSSSKFSFLKRVLSSVAGYCVALVVKTLPAAIFQGKHQIRCIVRTSTNPDFDTKVIPQHDTECWWVDHRRGDYVRQVISSASESESPSILLYNGTMGILAAGTTPFYGGGLRLFPFARMTPDKMHVRIGRIHPATGFFNIPKIFEGSYRDTSSDQFGVLDFIGTNFDVEVLSSLNKNKMNTGENNSSTALLDTAQAQSGYPFQHSGESVGLVKQFQLRVTKNKIRFLCLSPHRPSRG